MDYFNNFFTNIFAKLRNIYLGVNMYLKWNHSLSYISPWKGRIVKITHTNEYEEGKVTNLYTVKIKQELS